jgi:predicted nucleotidyltransferase
LTVRLADVNESVRVEYARLREAARQGTVAELCRRHGLDLLVVFGSVLTTGTDPRDLDVAVRFGAGNEAPDTLKILDDLYRLTGSERIDLMVLNHAAPLARERALTMGEPLFQRKSGDFANAQIAAIMQRLDTDRFRAMDLELMSS